MNRNCANLEIARYPPHIVLERRAAVNARKRSARRQDRQMILLCQRLQPAHMVDVLMRDEHGIEALRLYTAHAQPLRDPRRTDARIH